MDGSNKRAKRQADNDYDHDLPGFPTFGSSKNSHELKSSRNGVHSRMKSSNQDENNSSVNPVGIPALKNMLQTVPFGDLIYQIAMQILNQLIKPTLLLNELIQKVSNILAGL